MMPIVVWCIAIAIGVSLSAIAGSSGVWSSLAAASIILISFEITRRFKVAASPDVSKMSTAWLTHQLRVMIWRMLLALGLAAVAFKVMYPVWGAPFWISVAGYYQVGLLLHLRDIRQRT
jgi:hypothetical protein